MAPSRILVDGEPANSRQPQGLLDLVLLGSRIESMRTARNMASREELSERIMQTSSVDISPYTLGRFERGEQGPTFEQIIALTIALKPEIGTDWWLLATKHEHREMLEQALRRKLPWFDED